MKSTKSKSRRSDSSMNNLIEAYLGDAVLSETSGSYTGILVPMSPSERQAFFMGYSLGNVHYVASVSKTSKNPEGVFLSDSALKKLGRQGSEVRKSGIPGEFDFSTDEFFKSGIRGVI